MDSWLQNKRIQIKKKRKVKEETVKTLDDKLHIVCVCGHILLVVVFVMSIWLYERYIYDTRRERRLRWTRSNTVVHWTEFIFCFLEILANWWKMVWATRKQWRQCGKTEICIKKSSKLMMFSSIIRLTRVFEFTSNSQVIWM